MRLAQDPFTITIDVEEYEGGDLHIAGFAEVKNAVHYVFDST